MLNNPVKEALAKGQTVIGVGVGLYIRPVTARLMANAGFDFLFIDNEHSHATPNELFEMVQACRAYGLCPIVRVPDTEYHLIANSLDMGAQGLIVPRVESRQQAEKVIECSKFRPVGRRGYGTTAIVDFKPVNLAAALQTLNEQLLVIVQIESPDAVARADEIAAVPGVDVLLIGPADLSIALGRPMDLEHPQFIEAVDHVVAACRERKIVSGIVSGSLPVINAWWQKGMRFFSCSTESSLMSQAAGALAQQVRATVSPGPGEGKA